MDAGPIARTIAFVVPGVPVAWARAGSNNGMRFTPAKQRSFMAVLKAIAAEAMRGAPPIAGPVELSIRATWPAPSSWSAKKRAATRWRTSRPDADNCGKIVADALNGICFLDDAQVVSLHVWKTIGSCAELAVRITEIA